MKTSKLIVPATFSVVVVRPWFLFAERLTNKQLTNRGLTQHSASTFIPHPLLSQQAFSRFVQDYLVFRNTYLEKRTNRLGGILSLEP